jgi:hypothetical protein
LVKTDNCLFHVIAVVVLCAVIGCGEDGPPRLEGSDAPTISTVGVSPAAFDAGAGEREMQAIFFYVDPNKDLSSGVFLTRECGVGAETQTGVPFDSIDVRTTGVFVVTLKIDTNCDAGSYSVRFYAVDERGNQSNVLSIPYTLQ